jgi:hypothetical protein
LGSGLQNRGILLYFRVLLYPGSYNIPGFSVRQDTPEDAGGVLDVGDDGVGVRPGGGCLLVCLRDALEQFNHRLMAPAQQTDKNDMEKKCN